MYTLPLNFSKGVATDQSTDTKKRPREVNGPEPAKLKTQITDSSLGLPPCDSAFFLVSHPAATMVPKIAHYSQQQEYKDLADRSHENKVPKIAHYTQQQEYKDLADTSHENKVPKIAHHSQQQEYTEFADRSHDNKVLKNLYQRNKHMQPLIESFNGIPEESDLLHLGNQSLHMSNGKLAAHGVAQSYTELMQQMTVMSHLQSDNMAIPINSFTSFLTAGINSKHQATGPIASSNEQHLSNWGQYFVPSEQEHEEDDEANNEVDASHSDAESDVEREDGDKGNNEDEANRIDSESDGEHEFDCNSDENASYPDEAYTECNSDQNETDVEEDYLEQNTLSCDELLVERQHSELQNLEQSWNYQDSVYQQQMMRADQEVKARSSEEALQGPDYAETTDTDGTSGSDDSEFEAEQLQEVQQQTKNYEKDNSATFLESNEEDQNETFSPSGKEKMQDLVRSR
ncbi:uncharacterized protein [Aegilops tauschii subsp. strangulata]|uniref:uncharacterized protein n=1 Tax=Aegilops tauschii subsp. strangulata TaxID=200361 RepID=UPI00098B59E7